jgi:hypothetical protein
MEESKTGQVGFKRRQLNSDITPVLEFLKELHARKYPEVPKKERKVKGPKFVMNHSYETRAFVIWLRFGSIHEECYQPLITYRRIFEITGVKIPSQITMVRNWRKYGHTICNFRGVRQIKYWYTDEMIKYLLDPETLRKWAPYSLSYRVLMIE